MNLTRSAVQEVRGTGTQKFEARLGPKTGFGIETTHCGFILAACASHIQGGRLKRGPKTDEDRGR